MNIELYFAPGACSFVPHVALEAIKAATGQAFEPKLVKLHKGEHRTPEYLAMNPNGQVPVLVADGKPLTQIVAICEFLDRSFPKAGLLPTEPWARAQALSQLAWMNNSVHPTFTHVFRAAEFAESEAAQADVKKSRRGEVPRAPRAHPGLDRKPGKCGQALLAWRAHHLPQRLRVHALALGRLLRHRPEVAAGLPRLRGARDAGRAGGGGAGARAG